MPDHPRLCDLLVRWEEAKAAGKPLSAEELCAEEPELMAALRYRIAQLEAMDLLLEGASNPGSLPTMAADAPIELRAVDAPAWQPPGYEILGELGRGGMGVVYKARQLGLDRIVALKTIPASALAGSTALARFGVEGRAVARLRHPNIVQIYEIGNHGGCPYFSLEYLDGGNLARVLDHKPIDPLRAAQVAEVLARAVHYAHTRGIIHRDLKPANVLLAQPAADLDPALVKLGDFGLARLLDEGDGSHLTRTGTTMGTPSYMAPEQVQGRVQAIGPATDVYGLGALLYEMLCGRPPFRADTDWMTMHLVVSKPPEPVHDLRPDCPPPLEAICLRCLAKDPGDRYASVEALADDLRRFLNGVPVSAKLAGAGRQTRRAWIAAASLTAVGSLGAAAVALVVRRSSPIPVGIIQSQTEFMGDSGQAVINATLLAIDEVNQAGGVLGRELRPYVADGQSNELVFASEARRLIREYDIQVLFAGITSAHRRATEPAVREAGRLLIYPGESEGLELVPEVVCLGPLPNQHVLPAVGWFRSTLGKKRFFLVGSDSVYPHAVRAILLDYAASLGIELVGESYVDPADVVGWATRTVHRIETIEPDAVVSLIQGKANLAFVHRLRSRGVTPRQIPTLSCTFTEQDLRSILKQMVGDYLCGHYFQSLDTEANRRFLGHLNQAPRLCEYPVISDGMVAAYRAVHLYALAAARAGGAHDPRAVVRNMAALRPVGPDGPLQFDPLVQCDAKYSRIAQVGDDRRISVVWSSPAPWKPIAYPPTRSRAQWDSLIRGLYERWEGNWSSRGAIAARARLHKEG